MDFGRKSPPGPAGLVPESELDGLEPSAELGLDAERRRHARAPVDLAVRLRFGSLQDFIGAHAADLSLGGLLLRGVLGEQGRALERPGQLIRLEFDAGKERIVQGTGKVVRLVPPASPGGPAGVGIEFVELDARSRALIAAIVEARLAEPSGD